MLVSCILDAYACGGDCVDNNRIGMTKCVMTGVTYGDVPGV